MIAGEGLVGILLAILAIIPTTKLAADGSVMSVGQVIDLSAVANTGNTGAWIFFAALMGVFAYFIFKKDKKPAVNVVESTSSEAEEKKDAES